ncbi:MAG TPA: 16S rRNA (adenine(1518)-N(6)/adenine(1519)-N(6))-dimethyltransferase RsmA [Burkholderiaceae bacterium]|nr:16S rRNA (adenine(1518)-N(6)/adenine(1519)-N(6))-dimethyltransferase RsmA [Burkholderiaceae bacterium]
MSGTSTLQHRARKRFGQNFLHDRRVIERIVDAIDPRPGQAIVEIGPGQAALTRELVQRAGHITAVEIDRDLAAWLREQFTPEQLTLVEADALRLDWSSLATQPLRMIGNLPYNISSPLLFRLMEFVERVIDQHFMLQKEVVDRMVAPPGSKTYGRLSVMLQVRYRMTKLFDVPRGAFNPPPQVTSSIVRMVPRGASELPEIDFDRFGRVVAAAFNQRRKILRNALRDVTGEEAFRTAGVDPLARAETLAVDDFVRLARAVADVAPGSG